MSSTAAAIVVPGANGARGKTRSSTPSPPASAAGFVHRTSSPGRFVRPNGAFSGTGWPNVENATTQPSRRPLVDLLGDQPRQVERALRVADQHEAASAVVVPRVLAPRSAHVAVRV